MRCSAKYIERLRVNPAVAGAEWGHIDVEGGAVVVGDPAAGFFDEELADGTDVADAEISVGVAAVGHLGDRDDADHIFDLVDDSKISDPDAEIIGIVFEFFVSVRTRILG